MGGAVLLLFNLGQSQAALVVPSVPGVEYALSGDRAHYKLPDDRTHYALTGDLAHYTAGEATE